MLSIFIPVYNEEAILESSVYTVHRYLKDKNIDHEIVMVSNGSTDSTVQIGTTLAEKEGWFSFFALEERGAGRAFVLGVEKASGEYLVTLDVDLSSELLFLDYAIELLKYGVMVVGSKTMGTQRRSLLRIAGSQFYITFAQYWFDLTIADFSIGCKAFRRQDLLPVLKFLDLWTGFIFELCLYFKFSGKKIIQIGIDCEDTRKSRFSLLYEGLYRYHHLFRCYLRIRKKDSWFFGMGP